MRHIGILFALTLGLWCTESALAGTFVPEADYDPGIPAPDAVLGYRLGDRPASAAEIQRCMEAMAEAAGDRMKLERIGLSHEGRPLLLAVLGDEARIRERPAGAAPLVVWIGGAVHGDEPSGADAALALLHHWIADRREETTRLRAEALILISPVQNPDGHTRWFSYYEQWRSSVPNFDSQSMQHRQGWPTGRGNHYYIDLNRDWFALSQPETRARTAVFLRFRPHLAIDLHEMGSFDTYLFSPPREPHNPHLPATTLGWWDRLSRAQAEAFGARGWSCYTGDWNEEFNPNRGGSWPLFTGAIAILQEQAGVDGLVLRRREGTVLSFHDAVHHQFVASLAAVEAAVAGREGIRRDYEAARDPSRHGSQCPRAYLIDPSSRPETARWLSRTLADQGIEVRRAAEPFTLTGAVDTYGERRGNRTFPAGTYLVPLDRPEGRLARAILDFDPQISPTVRAEERRRLETTGASLFYETSAWSLAMAAGAAVYASDADVKVRSEIPVSHETLPGSLVHSGATYGFLMAGDGEGYAAAMASLLSAGVKVWASEEPIRIGSRAFGSGSLLVRRAENGIDLVDRLRACAEETGAVWIGVDHSLADEGADLGSRRFRLLDPPRVAILSGPPFYETTFGSIWHLLDQDLKLPCALLRLTGVEGHDLDRYNVIIVPDGSTGRGASLPAMVGVAGMQAIDQWMKRGGTLITLGEGSWILFGGEPPLAGLRERRQVLDKIDTYRRAWDRELGLAPRAGEAAAPATPIAPSAPPTAAAQSLAIEEEEWYRRFFPQGTILRVDLVADHWLATGVGPRVPVLVRNDIVLMSRQPTETVGRFAAAHELRMSGLLWPEAQERIARSAYVCRERNGRGQWIAFHGNPHYRAYYHGTGRLLVNAILLGPGMGSAAASGW